MGGLGSFGGVNSSPYGGYANQNPFAPQTQPQYNPYQQTQYQQQPQYNSGYTVDAWGRSMPAQQGFTPAFGYGGSNNYGSNPGNGFITGGTYNPTTGTSTGTNYGGTGGTGGSGGNSTSNHNSGDPNNPNPFGVHDPASYDRKLGGLPGFIPGATFINPLLGLGVEDTPERAAERAYNQANPGQSEGFGNRYFGTGKWEPYHPLDVTHNQSFGDNRKEYGEFNESGLGRDTNYDRFGNMRTVIPSNVADGSAYWNSSTGAWTDKKTGIPVGGSINDATSTPDKAKAQAIKDAAAKKAADKKAADKKAADKKAATKKAKDALAARQKTDNRDRESQQQKDAKAAVRAQLDVQAKKDNVTSTGHIKNPFEAQRTDTNNKSSNSSSSSKSSGGGGTHCCTAAYFHGMPIAKIKELRKWHRTQSKLWQEGYDVYGKFIADNLVSGSPFWSRVTEAGHTFFVEKKVTPMSMLAFFTIAPGSLLTGATLAILKKFRGTQHVLSK